MVEIARLQNSPVSWGELDLSALEDVGHVQLKLIDLPYLSYQWGERYVMMRYRMGRVEGASSVLVLATTASELVAPVGKALDLHASVRCIPMLL